MASHSRASIRYARALLLASEQDATGTLDDLAAEIAALSGLLAASSELVDVLDDPTIDVVRKHEVLASLFREMLSPIMWRFVELLVEKRREALLPDILAGAQALVDERRGRVTAEVRSAEPLSEYQRIRLSARLAEISGKEVTLSVEEDPSMVAGFVAQIGDTVYDASLGAQLAQLHSRLRRTNLEPAAHDRES